MIPAQDVYTKEVLVCVMETNKMKQT